MLLLFLVFFSKESVSKKCAFTLKVSLADVSKSMDKGFIHISGVIPKRKLQFLGGKKRDLKVP